MTGAASSSRRDGTSTGTCDLCAAWAAVPGSAASAPRSSEAAEGQTTPAITGATTAAADWEAVCSRGVSEGGAVGSHAAVAAATRKGTARGTPRMGSPGEGSLYSSRKSARLAKR
ncbi:hypothetical protein BE08_30910 [Sorangium cellulosum]|uniref:Uncharacterized protein n=1 Tax=Sorangium cellulosum TaxID=56 RepID=A0A150PJ68_SORCE|nr:hypothetical protein BE08_30910 [Sorangium cellulosum]